MLLDLMPGPSSARAALTVIVMQPSVRSGDEEIEYARVTIRPSIAAPTRTN